MGILRDTSELCRIQKIVSKDPISKVGFMRVLFPGSFGSNDSLTPVI